jgi:2-polyprenyl-3-methyl-5-hydroxy-6-metoxy-1,4-benzoquinol methylase
MSDFFNMNDFKSILYRNYLSTHNRQLYGEMSLEKIKNNFAVWDYYFGSLLPRDKDCAILDIGCGNGGFVYYLHQRGYRNACGIDLSDEQIEEGKSLGIANLRSGSATTMLAEANEYQCIVARDLLEHLTRQEAFDLLLLVSARLVKSGRFIMQVPNGQGIYFTSIFYGDYTHEQAFTESSVSQLFLNTGFSSSFCRPTGPVPHGFVSSVRSLLWKCKVLVHRFWKAVETGSGNGIFTSNLIAVGDKQ